MSAVTVSICLCVSKRWSNKQVLSELWIVNTVKCKGCFYCATLICFISKLYSSGVAQWPWRSGRGPCFKLFVSPWYLTPTSHGFIVGMHRSELRGSGSNLWFCYALTFRNVFYPNPDLLGGMRGVFFKKKTAFNTFFYTFLVLNNH